MSSNKAQDKGSDKMESEDNIEENDIPNKQESLKVQNDNENEKKKEENNSNEEDEEDEDEEEDSDGEHKVPLLDQPLEQTGTRERKKVQRFTSESKLELSLEIPHGRGTALGKIPRIEAKIMKNKADDLKILHRVLFNRNSPKPAHIKNNIRKFNGFEFKKDSDSYDKKFAFIQKFEMKQLKDLCDVLDLMKKGASIDIAERILGFLMEPKDSGKPLPSTGTPTKPKNNTKKGKNKGSKSKRTSKKPENHSEDEEAVEEGESVLEEENEKSLKRKIGSLTNSKNKKEKEEMEEDEPEEPADGDIKEELSEGSESGEDKTEKSKEKGKKVSKTSPSNKKGSEKNKEEDNSDQEKEDDENDKDEPESKKSKIPPTDDEIQTYVKQILEGANLEEITMKTVCERVYAHYPDFDLAHKKAFIKTTVKSLIST